MSTLGAFFISSWMINLDCLCSMGVILYEMLIGRLPFSASNHPALFKLILAGEFEIPKSTDHAAQVRLSNVTQAQLFSSILSYQGAPHHKAFPWGWLNVPHSMPPENSYVYCVPIFASTVTPDLLKDLIRKLLQVDASTRLGSSKGGSQDIKRHPFFQGFNWRDLITGNLLH